MGEYGIAFVVFMVAVAICGVSVMFEMLRDIFNNVEQALGASTRVFKLRDEIKEQIAAFKAEMAAEHQTDDMTSDQSEPPASAASEAVQPDGACHPPVEM